MCSFEIRRVWQDHLRLKIKDRGGDGGMKPHSDGWVPGWIELPPPTVCFYFVSALPRNKQAPGLFGEIALKKTNDGGGVNKHPVDFKTSFGYFV